MRRDREQVAKAFGLALRAERKKAGLSQEELAYQSLVDRTFISRTESGTRQPALTTVFRFAKSLGVSPAELVELTDSYMQKAKSTRSDGSK